MSRSRPLVDRFRRMVGVSHVDQLGDEGFLNLAYEMVLGRPIDPLGLSTRTASLMDGSTDREATLAELRRSPESKLLMASGTGAIHYSRLQFVKSFPRARTILDLGGASIDDPRGALVSMGYPYEFDTLTIVDLPNDQRHPLYMSSTTPGDDVVTDYGTVRYQYHSMHDLSRYPDASVDLIYSGQSFEHISLEQGKLLLEDVSRVLRPTGFFALDTPTPNRAATEVQLAGSASEFIDPDHKVEYRHSELVDMFAAANLEIVRACGANYLSDAIRVGSVDESAIDADPGLFDEIEMCYILCYVLSPKAEQE